MKIKRLFEKQKRDEQLQGALKRIRAKKGGEYPFAYAMVGNKEAVLAVDWRAKATVDKLMKETRKQKPRKVIVGKARLNGRVRELIIEKSKDVRSQLAKSGLPVRKAKIIESEIHTEGSESPNGGGLNGAAELLLHAPAAAILHLNRKLAA